LTNASHELPRLATIIGYAGPNRRWAGRQQDEQQVRRDHPVEAKHARIVEI
jgi:hypothetical protein